MTSDFSYQFTEKAVRDLDDILGYISFTLSNPAAAKDFYYKLDETIRQVTSFPEAGSSVINPSVALPNVRKCFVKNYTMYYVSDAASRIPAVLNARVHGKNCPLNARVRIVFICASYAKTDMPFRANSQRL